MAVEHIPGETTHQCGRCNTWWRSYTGLIWHILNTHEGGHYDPINLPTTPPTLKITEWP